MNTEWLYWSVRTDAFEIKLCPSLSYSLLGETVFIVLVFFVGEQLSLAPRDFVTQTAFDSILSAKAEVG